MKPLPATTSTYPFSTFHDAACPESPAHCARSPPSNSTTASVGGASGRSTGAGPTMRGCGRSMACCGQRVETWADAVVATQTMRRLARRRERVGVISASSLFRCRLLGRPPLLLRSRLAVGAAKDLAAAATLITLAHAVLPRLLVPGEGLLARGGRCATYERDI